MNRRKGEKTGWRTSASRLLLFFPAPPSSRSSAFSSFVFDCFLFRCRWTVVGLWLVLATYSLCTCFRSKNKRRRTSEKKWKMKWSAIRMGARSDTHQSDATELVSERTLFNTRSAHPMQSHSGFSFLFFWVLTEAFLRSLDLREKSKSKKVFI